MNELKLIDDIDNQLAGCTGMTREGHYQVQEIMQHYRKKVRAQQAKQQRQPTAEANDASK